MLRALVVTRKEVEKPDSGLDVEYELIAGERRLRASKLNWFATGTSAHKGWGRLIK